MLKLSRREEDFDSLNQYNQFYGKTEIGKILKKYSIFSEPGLRSFCLNELGGTVRDKFLSIEELCLIVYAIEIGTITLEEYIDTYEGDEDFLNKKFMDYYELYKDVINDIINKKTDITDAVFSVFPKRLVKAFDLYDISLEKEEIVDFCYDILYSYPETYIDDSYTYAEFIVDCLKYGLISVRDLVVGAFDPLLLLQFIDDLSEDSYEWGFIYRRMWDEGVFDYLKKHRMALLKKAIESRSTYDVKTLLENLKYTDEELRGIYLDLLLEKHFQKKSDIINMIESELSPAIAEEVWEEIYGSYYDED